MAERESTTPEALAAKKMKTTRSLKVRAKWNERRSQPNAMPWINLQGHWLQHAGFAIDTPVKVRVMHGCLVLTTQTPVTQPFELFEQLDGTSQHLVTRMIAELVKTRA